MEFSEIDERLLFFQFENGRLPWQLTAMATSPFVISRTLSSWLPWLPNSIQASDQNSENHWQMFCMSFNIGKSLAWYIPTLLLGPHPFCMIPSHMIAMLHATCLFYNMIWYLNTEYMYCSIWVEYNACRLWSRYVWNDWWVFYYARAERSSIMWMLRLILIFMWAVQ
jgi:hypothetical protein